MFQREGFKAIECLLDKVNELNEIVRINEIYLKKEENGTNMWHLHVDNDVFEALTSHSVQHVYQSDNEDDGLIVKRLNMQTANHIKLFTVYELKGADE